jgi:Protein of unknown function (DUF3224)
MSDRTTALGVAAVGLALFTGMGPKGAGMAQQAKGTFEVKVTPGPYEVADRVAAGRLTLDKSFAGDLAGSSKGEMWTADTSVQGSAGYVAIEKVTGTLRGRRGSFTLLHQGTMSHGGDFKLSVVVVPDSGTDQLAGLRGAMNIIIADGKHSYELDYELP